MPAKCHFDSLLNKTLGNIQEFIEFCEKGAFIIR
jgi:hypothetical protein